MTVETRAIQADCSQPRSRRDIRHTTRPIPADANSVVSPSIGNGAAAVSDRAEKLRRTIETEIIPRLLLAHSEMRKDLEYLSTREEAPSERALKAADVDAFTEVILQRGVAEARSYIDCFFDEGLRLEQIMLRLFAPAARRLGELWSADVCNFADVTIALGRLQQLLRNYSTAFEGELGQQQNGLRIMLMPVKSDQHTFGLYMLDTFFRRAGWRVDIEPERGGPSAFAKARSTWFDVIGLSASCDALLEQVACDIRQFRRASFNKSVSIMVGGPVFEGHPERAALVGADGTAEDGRQAVLFADRLVCNAARRRE